MMLSKLLILIGRSERVSYECFYLLNANCNGKLYMFKCKFVVTDWDYCVKGSDSLAFIYLADATNNLNNKEYECIFI